MPNDSPSDANGQASGPQAAPPAPQKRTAEDDALSHSLIQELMAAEAKRAQDDARRAEAERLAEDARRKEEARLEEEARAAEEARQAEAAARRAEEARLEEEARESEEARLDAEWAAADALETAEDAGATEVAAEDQAPIAAVPATAPVAPRRAFAQKTEAGPRPVKWDMPSDHEMSRKGRRIWQAAVYGGLLAVPAVFFALSPFGPRDTVGHHASAMGCQFAELFDMQNAEIGMPGYHPSLDEDANGIACEEKKGTRISMGGGASRFIKP